MSLAPFRMLCMLCAIVALLGVLRTIELGEFRFTDPTIPGYADNFYAYTFVRFERLSLYTTAAFFIGLSLYSARAGQEFVWLKKPFASRRLPLYVAAGVLIFAGIGRFLIHQNFDLCIDEYLNEFEARILLQHHLLAPLPDEWVSYESTMTVPFQIYHGDAIHGSWTSVFLPGCAFLDAVFDTLDLGWALPALLAGTSLLLLASLARRAFPDEPVLAANSAVLILACTPQFLMMALTKFAWPAHLCGTLLWVWLFTHPNRFLFLLTPILGAFLIGLHQPQVHFLVAAPFILRLLYTFQWRSLLWFGAWYLVAIGVWLHVYGLMRASATGSAGVIHNLGFPAMLSIYITTCHFITFYAWMTPILFPLVLIAVITWKAQPPVVRDSIPAAVITFLFYLSFPHMQGHGWGYRFMHPVYGLLALAGAGGLVAWVRLDKTPLPVNALICSLLFSLIIQVPYRIYEVRTMVRPLSLAWAYIASRPSDFVIVQPFDFWYADDLIRNDPWFKQKPLVFNGARLTASQKGDLARRGTVITVGANEVRPFHVILSDPKKKL